MARAYKICIGAILIALVIGTGAVWLLMRRGFSAREQPTSVEAFIARHLRHLAVPRAERERKNPIPATPEIMAEARAHFADHCATCHANDGSGQTDIGQGLYPKAPDMRLSSTQSLSDGELFYIIHNGVRFTGMPAWGQSASEEDEDSWKLVHFIRHLPQVGKGELEEMKKLNPISRHELEEENEMKKFLSGGEVPPKPPVKRR